MFRQAEDNLVRPGMTIRQALMIMDTQPIKMLIVVDEYRRLLATVTDGDIRRTALRTGTIDGTVMDAANTSPITIDSQTASSVIKDVLRDNMIYYLPVIDADRKVLGIVSADDHIFTKPDNASVVLMAGGLGKRLRPLTEKCPKPMLPLAGKPILHHIMDRFLDQGFKRFFLSINYLGHMIEDYFGDGSEFGCQISYLRENKRLGTGGALYLLPKNVGSHIIVMNGDLLTGLQFSELLSQHIQTGAEATMCVREHRTAIDFGVVKMDGSRYLRTDEKPTLKHHINAGIYCISNSARDIIPANEFYDMPTMFDDLAKADRHCSVHVMHSTWVDIGTPSEYQVAQKRFHAGSSPQKTSELTLQPI